MRRPHRPAHTATRDRILRTARSSPNLNNAQIAARAGCHPDTVAKYLPPGRAGRLSGARHRWTYTATGHYPGFPPEALWHAAGETRNPRPQQQPPAPSRRLLTACATQPAADGRAAAAAHSGCPKWLLSKLIDDHDRSVRQAAAKNPACPGGLLEQAVASPGREPAAAAAANPNCTPCAFAAAAVHKDGWVRSAAAANPNCPSAILRTFAADPTPMVQMRCADNPNCPADLLDRFASHTDAAVRGRAAANPNTADTVLAQLAADPHPLVRRFANASRARLAAADRGG